MKNPSWNKDGLNFLGKLLSLSNLKRRWLIEETKVRGKEPNKMETIFFINRWIKKLEDLKKAQEELVFENSQLKERTEQYEQAFKELRENLQEVNVSNARLLYTNRVLRNTSLNERQKHKIAEAISQAGSVTEAKTIYNTLESAVEAKPKQSPQSLSEAISRPSSVIRATRHESARQADPFLDRMQKLAGIK